MVGGARVKAWLPTVTVVILLICFEQLPAQQAPPISYGVAIGISQFDDIQLPKIPGAASSATGLAAALQGTGLAPRNVLVRTDSTANKDSVLRALRTVLNDRARATDSVLIYIAGNGRVDGNGTTREAYLMTYDSNPGAKRATALRISDLSQFFKDSQAGGIYLIVDLTGDSLQTELESLAKLPRVVLAAAASGPTLSGLGETVARGLLDGSKPNGPDTAGQLSERIRAATPNKQALLALTQPGAALFPSKPVLVSEVKPPLTDTGKTLPTKIEEKPVVETRPTPQTTQQTPVITEAQTRAANLQAALARARTLSDQQKWEDAMTAALDAMKIDPQSTEAWAFLRNLETSLVRAHKWDQVQGSVQRATKANLPEPQFQDLVRDTSAMVVSEASKQSNWREADTMFKVALSVRPSAEATRGAALAALHVNFDDANAALARRDFGDARDLFDAVVKVQGQFKSPADLKELAPLFVEAQAKSKQASTALVLQGAADQFNRGDYKTAQAIVGELLRNDPQNSDALNLLGKTTRGQEIIDDDNSGQTKLAQEDWQGALGDFDAALRVNPQDTQAMTGRKKAQDAIDQARAELAQQQRKRMYLGAGGSVLVALGIVVLAPAARRARVYTRLGWKARAIRVLERMIAKNPGRTDVVMSLSALYSSNGSLPAAVSLCTRYLLINPADRDVQVLLADAQFELREFPAARETYRRVLASDPVNSIACSRLLEIEVDPPNDESPLEIYEPALRANPDNPCLNRLVARYYLRQERHSIEALAVFQKALLADSGNIALRLAFAQACWKQENYEEAITQAGKVVEQNPENRAALSLWLEASQECGKLSECFGLVDSHRATGLRAILVCEEIAARDPSLRPMVHERYTRLLKNAATPEEQQIYSSHICIDDDATRAALTHLKVAVASETTGELHQRELARVLARFREAHRHKQDYPQAYADVLFRLGYLYRGLDSRGALTSFQQIVKLPEWQVRSTTAMQDILDSLGIDQLASIFFEEVGWDCKPESAGAGFADLIVNPPQESESKLHSMFGNCRVRCYSRPITLDDVVKLNRELAEQGIVNREFTFVVSPLRARQDVLALIYALLTEQPSLRVIPFESVVLKQAIIEGKSGEALEQILRLWVGQGDLFDVHSPIADAGTFFGRGQFIHTLTTKIIHGENFGIFGLRKVGKTSLVFQLRENLPRNLIGYADLQSIASRRCDEIYFRLSSALRRELRIKFPEVPAIASFLTDFDANRSYPTIATDFHNELLKIKEALESQGQQPRVLLLLDEIELLISNDQTKGFAGFEDFFRQIRGLYQQEGFVLSGVIGADPNACRAGKWGDRDNPIFQYYDEIFLSPLDRSECDQMVLGIGEVMGVSFDALSLEKIYDETGGHPYVGRQLCSRIVSRHSQRPLKVLADLVDEGVEDYIAQRPDYFVGVFRGYISEEARKLLEVTALNDDNDASHADLLAFSIKAGLERGRFDRALQDLELFHLLSRAKDRYHIKILLLRRWIRRSWLGID
jgi:tetratricopeptide (TPR) repeat protein